MHASVVQYYYTAINEMTDVSSYLQLVFKYDLIKVMAIYIIHHNHKLINLNAHTHQCDYIRMPELSVYYRCKKDELHISQFILMTYLNTFTSKKYLSLLLSSGSGTVLIATSVPR